MKNHKLIQILKTFNKKEVNAFVRFVNTSYFNRKEEVILLIEYLKKYYPKFSENHIKKEKLFMVVSPKKKVTNRFFDDTVYNTIKLVEQFLVIETINNDSNTYSKVLMNAYQKRDLFEFGLKVIDKQKKQIDKLPISFETEYLKFDFDLNHYYMEVGSYNEDSANKLYLGNNQLSIFYWINKLIINDELNARKEVVNALKLVISDREKILLLTFIKGNENELLKILYFLNYPDEEYKYETIKEILFKIIIKLNYNLKKKIVIGLINYCKRKYTKTQENQYLKEWYYLYKKGIDCNAIIANKAINDTTFLNIVHLGLLQKDYEWIKYFIKSSKLFLKDKMLYNLANGMLKFSQKKYEEALNELLEVNFGHIHQNLTARSIIAKIHYESAQYDNLEIHLNAYEIYLRRQKDISEQLKEVNLNFVFATRKMAKAIFDKKTLASLKKDIKEKPIAYKSWFKDQLLLL